MCTMGASPSELPFLMALKSIITGLCCVRFQFHAFAFPDTEIAITESGKISCCQSPHSQVFGVFAGSRFLHEESIRM